MTSAQIELMVMDVPLIQYDKPGEKKHTKKELDKLTERWMARKKADEEKGIKFNINDFIKTGEIKENG